MSTQSQKNEKEIIKLQGELKLIHNKIDTIKNNQYYILITKLITFIN